MRDGAGQYGKDTMNDTIDPRAGAWDGAAARRRLDADGFCLVPGVLDPDSLRATREMADAALASVGADHRAQWKSQGSLIAVSDHPSFAALIAHPGFQDMFRHLGFGGTLFSSGYVISKPPGGPALFWHQDWWGWQHAISRDARIAQIALFLYLTDTTRENGCLRLIPGSHRRAHQLHDLVDAHDPTLAEVKNPDDAAFASHPDEIDVPVTAGDVVVVDARLIHGAHPNRTDLERTNITLWWHPDYEDLPAEIRARIWQLFAREESDTDIAADRSLRPDTWPEPYRSRALPFVVTDPGPVAPEPWVRTPKY